MDGTLKMQLKPKPRLITYGKSNRTNLISAGGSTSNTAASLSSSARSVPTKFADAINGAEVAHTMASPSGSVSSVEAAPTPVDVENGNTTASPSGSTPNVQTASTIRQQELNDVFTSDADSAAKDRVPSEFGRGRTQLKGSAARTVPHIPKNDHLEASLRQHSRRSKRRKIHDTGNNEVEREDRAEAGRGTLREGQHTNDNDLEDITVEVGYSFGSQSRGLRFSPRLSPAASEESGRDGLNGAAAEARTQAGEEDMDSETSLPDNQSILVSLLTNDWWFQRYARKHQRSSQLHSFNQETSNNGLALKRSITASRDNSASNVLVGSMPADVVSASPSTSAPNVPVASTSLVSASVTLPMTTRRVAKRAAEDLHSVNPRPKRQQTWKALPCGNRKLSARVTPKPSCAESLSKRRLLAFKKHWLHCESTVQDIKGFLSGLVYDRTRLFIYPKPIAYSSGNEKRRIKQLEQSQERVSISSWIKSPLQGAAYRLGVFMTWKDTWVGRVEQFKQQWLHLWVAILITVEGRHGKCLVIYDSNSDLLKKGKITKNDLLLGKQRELINLVKKEKYKLTDIWAGGEGNTEQDICVQVTANWIQECAKAGGLDIDKLEKMGFRRIEGKY